MRISDWSSDVCSSDLFAIAELGGRTLPPPPPETALGALLGHITGGADASSYQPMNVNFGLFPPLAEDVRKKDRKLGYTRSEEHTSELQSLMRTSYAVFCLKKKTRHNTDENLQAYH